MALSIVEEIRGILDGGSRSPARTTTKPAPKLSRAEEVLRKRGFRYRIVLGEARLYAINVGSAARLVKLHGGKAESMVEMGPGDDPADRALELVSTYKNLISMLQEKVKHCEKAWDDADKQCKAAKKFGGAALHALDLIGNRPLSSLRDVDNLVDQAIIQIDSIVKEGNVGRGSMGARREWISKRLKSLAEGNHDPQEDTTQPNADANDYGDENAAAFQHASDFISAVKQLEPGDNVYVGQTSLHVVNAPVKKGEMMLVTLHEPDPNGAYEPASDGYTLLIPAAPENNIDPKMEWFSIRANGRTLRLRMNDVRLQEQNDDAEPSDNMYSYDDFELAPGKIEPGDIVDLGGTLMRVIGKTSSAMLVQPEQVAAQMAAGFVTPPNPEQNRGGTETRDASEVPVEDTEYEPGESDGHTPIGAMVLKYNPHEGHFVFPSGKEPGDYEAATQIRVVGHDPSMPSVVGEAASPDRFDMILDEATGSTTMERIRSLAAMDGDQAVKVNGVLVDTWTARGIRDVHEALGADNKTKMESLPVYRMITVARKTLGIVSPSAL